MSNFTLYKGSTQATSKFPPSFWTWIWFLGGFTYISQSEMNMGKSTDYESILRMADMNTLEHRRIEQSLMIFFKCFKENGPGYVANLFKPRVTPYNLRSNGLNVVQTSYNSRFLHGSYAYTISHIWNQLPSAVKNAPNASSFRRLLTKLNFIGCQCSNCLWPDLFL